MKKTKILIATAVILAMSSIPVIARDEAPLFKYGTNNPILLDGEQITVPVNFENKEEDFRATWVSTVFNIDFPKIHSEAEFRAEFQKVVNNCKEIGLNTVIFQVRPMIDAWYKSEINPSSEFISGKQGAELTFDPLEIAVELAHEQGLELHAWFNPYRVTNNTRDYRKKEDKLNDLDDKNFAKQNPELVYEFANKLFLDPGRPEVLEHITDTINEVLENYDVDAIHFDDYFYPYKTTFNKVLGYDENGEAIVDENRTTMAMRDGDVDFETFENYSRGFTDVHAWREDNINLLVKNVQDTVRDYNNVEKESVQFGISPFGIWGHAEEIEGGSNTPVTSTASINDYVNTKKWAQEEMLDYLLPQIYWQFNQPAAEYGELVDWWDEQFDDVDDTHLYIGHPNYKIIENSAKDFENPDEIPSQLRFNQKYENVKGSAFFSYNKLDGRTHTKEYKPEILDFRYEDYILNGNENISRIAGRDEINKATTKTIKEYYSSIANVPEKEWLDHYDTEEVEDIKAKSKKDGVTITWEDENEDSKFYKVYRVDGKHKDNDVFEDAPELAIDRFGISKGTSFIDTTVESGKNYTYGVSVVDKSDDETDIEIVSVKAKK